jgi:hypothetical protein
VKFEADFGEFCEWLHIVWRVVDSLKGVGFQWLSHSIVDDLLKTLMVDSIKNEQFFESIHQVLATIVAI